MVLDSIHSALVIVGGRLLYFCLSVKHFSDGVRYKGSSTPRHMERLGTTSPRRRHLAQRDRDEITGASWLVRWLYDSIVLSGGLLMDIGNYECSREEIYFQYTKSIMPERGSCHIEFILGGLHVEQNAGWTSC